MEYEYTIPQEYIPPHHQLALRSDELVEDYDAVQEMVDTVNQAFGEDDYNADLEMLTRERLSAEACGCGSCRQAYDKLLEETCMKYVISSGDL